MNAAPLPPEGGEGVLNLEGSIIVYYFSYLMLLLNCLISYHE